MGDQCHSRNIVVEGYGGGKLLSSRKPKSRERGGMRVNRRDGEKINPSWARPQ